jgi:hypothetical protein
MRDLGSKLIYFSSLEVTPPQLDVKEIAIFENRDTSLFPRASIYPINHLATGYEVWNGINAIVCNFHGSMNR